MYNEIFFARTSVVYLGKKCTPQQLAAVTDPIKAIEHFLLELDNLLSLFRLSYVNDIVRTEYKVLFEVMYA